MCSILQSLNDYLYAIGKDPIFNQRWHSYALESKGHKNTTGRSC